MSVAKNTIYEDAVGEKICHFAKNNLVVRTKVELSHRVSFDGGYKIETTFLYFPEKMIHLARNNK